MQIFKKIILVFIFISFLTGSFCLAQGKGRQLEIGYPTLPGVETPTVTQSSAFGDYLKYFFTLALIIAGLLAFGAMIYGGIRYLTSAGDPTKMKDGMNQVGAAFLGMIILLSSYLILNTINPKLVVPNTPSFEGVKLGIHACVTADCVDDPENHYDNPVLITESSPDLEVELPEDADGIPQDLKAIKFLSAPEDLTVKIYSGANFTGNVEIKTGGQEEIVSAQGKSIELLYHYPGVYLFAEKDCGENSDYKIYQAGSSTLLNFDDKTQSIEFVYGFSKKGETKIYDKKYAAILHEQENAIGKAELFDQEEGECKNIGADLTGRVSSISVYLKPLEQSPYGGVTFFGDNNYTHDKEDFVLGPYKDKSVSNIEDEQEDSDNKITSMEINGHYIALLFENPDYEGNCEVFMSSEPNFRNHRIGQCGLWGRGDCLSSFIIRARK